jgi:hypothetical protein
VCSLIICGCVPAFRPFLRLFPYISRLLKPTTDGSKTNLTGQRQSAIPLEGRNRWNTGEAGTFGRSNNVPTMPRSDDNDSQAEILRENGMDSNDGITVTKNVQIEYSNNEEGYVASDVKA